MRLTHAYRLAGIDDPRSYLLSVYLSIDGVERHLGSQGARELARDLVTAADRADRDAAEVRRSLLSQ